MGCRGQDSLIQYLGLGALGPMGCLETSSLLFSPVLLTCAPRSLPMPLQDVRLLNVKI